MSVKARMGQQFHSKVLSDQEASAKLLKVTECDLENRQAIETALQHPTAPLPPKFEAHFDQYQYLHQRRYLRQVNYIGQMVFLLYFFVDYFVIPDVSLLSGIMRVFAVTLALVGNYFCFKYVKDIQLLDLILPISATLCCGVWFYILSQSHSPWVGYYLYAAVIYVVMANLCIQVRFRPALYNSLLMSVLIFLSAISLTTLQDALIFMVVYIPMWLLSLYISWSNTLNARHHFLRSLLDDWNFHTLQALAHTDELTQLNNRRQFVHMAEHKIHQWPKSNSICLLMFDVDFFKQINDTYGHDVGDRVLQNIAEIARKEMRRQDILARFGGEEFIALLSETSLDEALVISERLRQKIAQHQMCVDKKSFNFTVSIGVSSLKPQQTDLQLLIKEADIALYQAKQSGRNCVISYDVGMSESPEPILKKEVKSWMI